MKQTITIVLIFCLSQYLKAYSLSPQPTASMDVSGYNDTELPGWSQGETFASVNLSDNFLGDQPLLQPEITVISSERFGKPGFQVKVYPNPATDFIRVEWRTDVQTEVNVELYDLVGRMVTQRRSDNQVNNIRIDMEPFQKSAYLVKIYTSDGEYSRTFRIVKN
jgi:hypothetical protein